MIRDIDALKGFEPAVARKDPLKGFVEAKNSRPLGNPLQGYSISLSRTSIRVSIAAREFLDTDYVEILLNVVANKLAIKPSSRSNLSAFKLTDSRSKGDHLGRQLTVNRHVREAVSKFPNLNLERYRYRFAGERYDDGAAGVLIFDLSDPTDASLLSRKGR